MDKHLCELSSKTRIIKIYKDNYKITEKTKKKQMKGKFSLGAHTGDMPDQMRGFWLLFPPPSSF